MIKGAIYRYKQIETEVNSGKGKYIYRSGDEIRREKEKKKDWPNTWFLKGDVRNTRSCPVTPGGELKKALVKAVNVGDSRSIQVIEDGGIPIHCNLMVKDPMRPIGCIFGDPKCIVNAKYPCDKAGVIYMIQYHVLLY